MIASVNPCVSVCVRACVRECPRASEPSNVLAPPCCCIPAAPRHGKKQAAARKKHAGDDAAASARTVNARTHLPVSARLSESAPRTVRGPVTWTEQDALSPYGAGCRHRLTARAESLVPLKAHRPGCRHRRTARAVTESLSESESITSRACPPASWPVSESARGVNPGRAAGRDGDGRPQICTPRPGPRLRGRGAPPGVVGRGVSGSPGVGDCGQ